MIHCCLDCLTSLIYHILLSEPKSSVFRRLLQAGPRALGGLELDEGASFGMARRAIVDDASQNNVAELSSEFRQFVLINGEIDVAEKYSAAWTSRVN